ncbi:MAG: hypothetical protein PHI13_16610 [Methylococcales bacterium]|nr:hypothetical protein [Methylococcales bacterium]
MLAAGISYPGKTAQAIGSDYTTWRFALEGFMFPFLEQVVIRVAAKLSNIDYLAFYNGERIHLILRNEHEIS